MSRLLDGKVVMVAVGKEDGKMSVRLVEANVARQGGTNAFAKGRYSEVILATPYCVFKDPPNEDS